MRELDDQYNDAPRLRAPQSLDQAVLGEAKRRVGDQPRTHVFWQMAPRLASLGVAVLGVTLLLRSGVPSFRDAPAPDIREIGQAPMALESATNEQASSREGADVQLNTLPSASVADQVAEDAGDVVRRSAEADMETLSPEQSKAHSQESRRAKSSLLSGTSAGDSIAEESTGNNVAASQPATLNSRSKVQRYSLTESVEQAVVGDNLWILRQPGANFSLVLESWTQTDVDQLRNTGLVVAVVPFKAVDDAKSFVSAGSFSTRKDAEHAILSHGLQALQLKVVAFSVIQSRLQ